MAAGRGCVGEKSANGRRRLATLAAFVSNVDIRGSVESVGSNSELQIQQSSPSSVSGGRYGVARSVQAQHERAEV
jgi:hypothetical protein